MTTHTDRGEANIVRRANPLGAYITTVGALVFLLSIWLDWVNLGPTDRETNPSSGYEADGVIPLLAYLGIGFSLALLYATKRADRRQHRGLSLASFAVGLAALLWTLSFLIDAISTVQYQENVSTGYGLWIGLLGSLLWTAGSFLLAKEPEGDREHDGHITHAAHPTEVRRTAEVHHTNDHGVHHTNDHEGYRPGTATTRTDGTGATSPTDNDRHSGPHGTGAGYRA